MIITSGTRIGPGVTIKEEYTPVASYLPSTLFELDASTYTSGDWIDSTGNGHNGILNGNPNWSSEAGGCFNFTAGLSQYIEVSGTEYGPGLANNPAQATFSVWANIPGPEGFQHVAGWRGGLDFWFLILTGGSTTEARFDNGTARDIGMDYGPYMNTWAMTTFVVDAAQNETRLYINGVLVGNNTNISGNFSAGGVPFTLGSNTGLGFPMTGKIGGVTAYQATLTPQEIIAEFNRTKGRYGL